LRLFKEEGRRDITPSFKILDEAIAHHYLAVANTTGDQAHFSLSFLIWHTCYLREIETALQSIIPNVTIPYWDWTIDAELDDLSTSILFTSQYFGSSNEITHIVETGAFSNWSINDDPIPLVGAESPAGLLRSPRNPNPHPFLTRFVGSSPFALPTVADYNYCLSTHYSYGDFCTCVDIGPVPQTIHGRPHFATGGFWPSDGVFFNAGDVADVYTSPADPLFFSHHANLDRLFMRWREEIGEELITEENPCGDFYGSQRQPQPPGHNLHDIIQPLLYTFTNGFDKPLTLFDACYYIHSSRTPFQYV